MLQASLTSKQARGHSSALRVLVLGRGWGRCASQNSRRGTKPSGRASCHLAYPYELEGHRPSAPRVGRCRPFWTPGSLWDRPRPRPWRPILPAPASQQAPELAATSPTPLEMKPELRDAGSSVPGPAPGTAIPTHGTSAAGVGPRHQAGRGWAPPGNPGRLRSQAGVACCLPTLSSSGCQLSRNPGRPRPFRPNNLVLEGSPGSWGEVHPRVT